MAGEDNAARQPSVDSIKPLPAGSSAGAGTGEQEAARLKSTFQDNPAFSQLRQSRLRETGRIAGTIKTTATFSGTGSASPGVGFNVPDTGQQNAAGENSKNVDAVAAPGAEPEQEPEAEATAAPEAEAIEPEKELPPEAEQAQPAAPAAEQSDAEKKYYQGPPGEQAAAAQKESETAKPLAQEQTSAEGGQSPQEEPQQNPGAEADQPGAAQPAEAEAPAEQAKAAVEGAGGKWLINFLYGSMLTVVGIIWALPALDIYVLIGLFSKNPILHQLSTWQKVVLALVNILVAILIMMLIYAVFYTVCTGLLGVVAKAVGFFFPQYAFCKDLGF